LHPDFEEPVNRPRQDEGRESEINREVKQASHVIAPIQLDSSASSGGASVPARNLP
jgi:hypothetical protein